jgi:carboxypeptidase Taq
MSNLDKLVKEFKGYVSEMKYYNDATAVLYWDLRTKAPRKGMEERSKVISMLSSKAFEMMVSEKMGQYIEKLEGEEKLDEVTKAIVKECKKEFERNKKIPKDRYKEYVELVANSESVWEEAKAKSDFNMFKPYLEKVVEFQKEFIEYWGYNENKYNALLDQYEPGMTVKKFDRVFKELREKLVPLVRAIQDSKIKPKNFFDSKFNVKKQKEFCKYILKEIGYDFDAGRLDESVHPFTIGFNPGDVRVTTRFSEDAFEGALFGAIHEGGHALYEQNISKKLIGTPLCDGTSSGIHESQSRFWENIVGRSKDFWSKYYYELLKFFPEAEDIGLDEFYKGVNRVQPSFIRVDADECTYNLHIMLRYELEKGLINDEIKVEDLPQIWNDKMEEYLGIRPENDAKGVLQDVHWAGGMFGYFPSYALGNIYSAQILNAIKKDIPDFYTLVSKGEFTKIVDYLRENIYKHGKMLEPNEIMKRLTGEEINGSYLVEYLQNKYKEIYNL